MWVWDTLMRHVRALCHNTEKSMPWEILLQPKTPKKEGEMKVRVQCARGVQVASFTLHHRGCTLVSPSTWATRVPRVLQEYTSILKKSTSFEVGLR